MNLCSAGCLRLEGEGMSVNKFVLSRLLGIGRGGNECFPASLAELCEATEAMCQKGGRNKS